MSVANTQQRQSLHRADSDLPALLDVLRKRVPIGVIYSGNPDDADVVVQRTRNARPWKSYRAVAEQIADALCRTGFFAEIVEEGPELRRALELRKYLLYWVNSGGIQGRAPTAHAPAQLEALGYPYIGHTPLQSALLDDKVLLKQWLRGVGLPTAPFIVRAAGFRLDTSRSDSDYVREFGQQFRGPYLVKPALGRGSVNVEVIEHLSELDAGVRKITEITNDRVIIEQFLPGQEYCVWVSRGIELAAGVPVARTPLMTFGHSERIFPAADRIYRKSEPGGVIADPARPLTERERQLRDDLSYVGRAIYSGLCLHVPVRVDLRLDGNGCLSVLEVNPKPDLKQPEPNQTGLLTIALADLGCSYEDFIVKTVADWLDFHLRCSPAALAMLLPLFERYAPPAAGSVPA